MSEMKDKQLVKLITSQHFTPELFLHYLIRKYDDYDIMDNLVMRLYNFDAEQISSFLFYLIYFVLKNPNQMIESFLCSLCSESAHHYFKIYSLTEAFGKEMSAKNEETRTRIDKLLEAFECSMVNEDNRYNGLTAKKHFSDQIEMMEHSINKRIKNDFKDDVKYFFHLTTKPAIELKEMEKEERLAFLTAYIDRINDWFHQRRKSEEFPTVKGMKLLHGFTMPFENFPKSSTIVRLNKDDLIIFETKERSPYMVIVETIDADELEETKPLFKKDVNYLRMKEARRKEGDIESTSKCSMIGRLKKRFRSVKQANSRSYSIESKARGVSSHMSDRISDKIMHITGPNWCNRKANLMKEYCLSIKTPALNQPTLTPKCWDHYFELLRNSVVKNKENTTRKFIKPVKGLGPWKTMWKNKEAMIIEKSPYGHFKSLKIRPMMVKAGDDLRQELLALKLIRIFQSIFEKESVNVYLRPYDVIIRNHNSGFIEFIPDTISIDSLKKKYPGLALNEIFIEIFKEDYEMAQLNFLRSLVAYSLVCLILKVRDRHNGNILLDAEGHIIHIDFGFILSNSPGGIDFETAPFKLTNEYVQVLGGKDSNYFNYFKVLMIQGMTALFKHSDEILNILKIMSIDSPLPCFSRFFIKDVEVYLTSCYLDDERKEQVENLIYDSMGSKKTSIYDQYQKYTNNIEP